MCVKTRARASPVEITSQLFFKQIFLQFYTISDGLVHIGQDTGDIALSVSPRLTQWFTFVLMLAWGCHCCTGKTVLLTRKGSKTGAVDIYWWFCKREFSYQFNTCRVKRWQNLADQRQNSSPDSYYACLEKDMLLFVNRFRLSTTRASKASFATWMRKKCCNTLLQKSAIHLAKNRHPLLWVQFSCPEEMARTSIHMVEYMCVCA